MAIELGWISYTDYFSKSQKIAACWSGGSDGPQELDQP